MLTLQHLERQCNGKTLFSHLGVTLLPGCLLRLTGGAASGKTTLLDILAGNRPCPRGLILFAGEETRGDKDFFADLHYFPETQQDITLRWKVEKQLQHWAKSGQNELVQAAIRYFQLEALLGRRIAGLSAGERQQVRLARLMIQPRALWLLDRPFLYLDEPGIRQLENLIVSRCEQSGIVIFTHDGETRLNPHGLVELAPD